MEGWLHLRVTGWWTAVWQFGCLGISRVLLDFCLVAELWWVWRKSEALCLTSVQCMSKSGLHPLHRQQEQRRVLDECCRRVCVLGTGISCIVRFGADKEFLPGHGIRNHSFLCCERISCVISWTWLILYVRVCVCVRLHWHLLKVGHQVVKVTWDIQNAPPPPQPFARKFSYMFLILFIVILKNHAKKMRLLEVNALPCSFRQVYFTVWSTFVSSKIACIQVLIEMKLNRLWRQLVTLLAHLTSRLQTS